MRKLFVLLVSLLSVSILTSCYNLKKDYDITESKREVSVCEELTKTSGTKYILNTHSDKFHYPSCESARRISTKNREEYFGTREELIEDGYSPCGNCDS